MQVQDFSLKALGARDETTMSDSRLVARFQSWGSPQKFDHGAELSGRASTPPNPEGIPRPLHYPGNRFFAGPIFLLTPRPKFQQQFHSGAKLSGGAGSVVAEIGLARWRGGQSDQRVSPSSFLVFIRVVKISDNTYELIAQILFRCRHTVHSGGGNIGVIIYFDGVDIFCTGGQVVVTTSSLQGDGIYLLCSPPPPRLSQ